MDLATFNAAFTMTLQEFNKIESASTVVRCEICKAPALIIKGDDEGDGFKIPVSLCENCYDNVMYKVGELLDKLQ